MKLLNKIEINKILLTDPKGHTNIMRFQAMIKQNIWSSKDSTIKNFKMYRKSEGIYVIKKNDTSMTFTINKGE